MIIFINPITIPSPAEGVLAGGEPAGVLKSCGQQAVGALLRLRHVRLPIIIHSPAEGVLAGGEPAGVL